MELPAGDYTFLAVDGDTRAEGSLTVEGRSVVALTMPCEKIREGTDKNRYQYTLVPGETYRYIATSGEFYHTADEFTMEEAADSTIAVSVPR